MMPSTHETYAGMKDSGVEWLGDIPEHWETKRLSVVGRFSKGGGFSKSDLKEKGTNAILYGDIYTQYDYYIGTPIRTICPEIASNSIKLKKNDLLFTGSGETKEDIGKCVLFSDHKDAVAGGDVIIFRQVENIPMFLSLVLNTHGISEEKAKSSKGEIIVHTYASKLRELRIPIPPLPEQRAIADFLDKKTSLIDKAISVKTQQIELLKERKQILIQNAVIQGLPSTSSGSRKMRDSGVEWIGEIPKHWKTTRVKNIFRLVMEPSEINNDHELLSIYTAIGVRPRKDLAEKGNKASTTDGYWLVKKGDFIVNKLLAWMGAIGISEYEGVTSPAYDILRATKPLDGYFYHYLFRTSACSEELKTHSRGIMEMRLRLYFDKFGVVEVPYPPKEEQTAIVAHIEAESSKIDQAIALSGQQIEKLNEYKTTLINSAVTGKIKVVDQSLEENL